MAARNDRFRNVRGLALAALAGVTAYACQETPGTAGGSAMCTYAQTVPCGEANKCTSTCLPDLSAYGPCVCGDAGADASNAGKKDAR